MGSRCLSFGTCYKSSNYKVIHMLFWFPAAMNKHTLINHLRHKYWFSTNYQICIFTRFASSFNPLFSVFVGQQVQFKSSFTNILTIFVFWPTAYRRLLPSCLVKLATICNPKIDICMF